MGQRSHWPDILSPDISETTEAFLPQESGISFPSLAQVSSEMPWELSFFSGWASQSLQLEHPQSLVEENLLNKAQFLQIAHARCCTATSLNQTSGLKSDQHFLGALHNNWSIIMCQHWKAISEGNIRSCSMYFLQYSPSRSDFCIWDKGQHQGRENLKQS